MKLQHVEFNGYLKYGINADHISLKKRDSKTGEMVENPLFKGLELDVSLDRRLLTVSGLQKHKPGLLYDVIDLPFELVKVMVRTDNSLRIEKARKVNSKVKE
jgi:hypothetical protein